MSSSFARGKIEESGKKHRIHGRESMQQAESTGNVIVRESTVVVEHADEQKELCENERPVERKRRNREHRNARGQGFSGGCERGRKLA